MEEKARPYEVVWSPHAESSLTQIADYIAKNSPHQAQRVRIGIINLSFTLSKRAYYYEECVELPTAKGVYRKALYANTYKIIYKIVKDEVWILDIFHGKQSPKKLKAFRRIKP